MQSDISSMLGRGSYKSMGFPDIVENFYHGRDLVIRHEQCLVTLLKENNVKINEYKTFTDFKNEFLGNEDKS